MQRSDKRILTTHTGSLPRPADLVQMVLAQERGDAVDEGALTERIATATREIVDQQLQAGVDVVNDGEASKPSYSTYVKDRLNGFGGPSQPPSGSAAEPDFPDFVRARQAERLAIAYPTCNGPISIKDATAVQRDIANLKAALAGKPAVEAFMSAASPGQIARFQGNTYYASDEAYIFALADAMHSEYRAIVEAGFVLQLDCPDLASGRTSAYSHLSVADWLKIAAMHVKALNTAIAGLPADRIRLHLCWGNYEGPHTRDVPIRDILPAVFRAKVGGLSFEAANPRHEHEWRVWQDLKLPEGWVLIPGVLDSCTNYVEHPELVAQRIVRFAQVAGRENVIAGTDCGFSTSVGSSRVEPSVARAKLAAMAEGACIASRTLWP
ncbi:MAG TPA: cobalamin-independent methionine synthase II family protein [Chloroflexota bacterium]|nr:cobalamin-independent methionine synthase II family protein [Chloroflexota bacterium]